MGCLALPALSQAQELPPGEAIMERMLDRLAARLRQRSDLRDRLSPEFDKDSVGHYGLKGLSRSEDSTVIAWFTGFAEMLQVIDGPSCKALVAGPPSASRIARAVSNQDSLAVARWLIHWETATLAWYLAPERPPIDDEAMMGAIFKLIAELPDGALTVSTGSPKKKKKPSAEQECRSMRDFFASAVAMAEPERTTLLRGLVEKMAEEGMQPALTEE